MRISCGRWKPSADAGETITRSERCGIPCGPGDLSASEPSIESLRRELSRNAQLRMVCGFAGVSCAGQDQCPVASGLRIPLETDRRVFTPIDRASYQWVENMITAPPWNGSTVGWMSRSDWNGTLFADSKKCACERDSP